MAHWSAEYIGKKWTLDDNCYSWFRTIQLKRFGREVPFLPICNESREGWGSFADRLINEGFPEKAGWRKSSLPVEGDAVFMSQGSVSHHIGIFILIGSTKYIIHCLENAGVVLSTFQNLRTNGWKINGYWTPKS